jgi:lysozyme family protein
MQEGGYSNNPNDPGGATMHGVTLATYRTFKSDPSLTAADVHAISDADVQTIYRKLYWDVMSCDKLPAGVDLMVFDFGVNAGPERSIKFLQSALGVPADGEFGEVSVEALGKLLPTAIIRILGIAQESYYRSLPTFKEFGEGWIKRIDEREVLAFSMAAAKQT